MPLLIVTSTSFAFTFSQKGIRLHCKFQYKHTFKLKTLFLYLLLFLFVLQNLIITLTNSFSPMWGYKTVIIHQTVMVPAQQKMQILYHQISKTNQYTKEGFFKKKHSCGLFFQNCAIHQYYVSFPLNEMIQA